MAIPRDNEELKALLPALPPPLQVAVICWCRGEPIPDEIWPKSRSSYYRHRRLLATLGLNLDRPHPAPFSNPSTDPLPCYSVKVEGAQMSFHTWAGPVMKDGVFLSPLGRLCAAPKSACLESEPLAQALADARLPSLRRRHGEQLELHVQSVRLPATADSRERIAADSRKANGYLNRRARVR